MKIYDVTVPISKELIVYPGDPLVKIRRLSAIGQKDGKYNLSVLTLGSHTGTHIDSPFHLFADGETVDRLPLELLLGRARVVEITSARIDETVLREFDLTTEVRLLFKTRNSYLWSSKAFVKDYVHLTVDAARYLVQEGIKLIGIDYLSVDKADSEELEVHKELLQAGVIIIEGLDLREVEPGDYELICLPLKIQGGDGAPARVVLRQN